MSSVLQEWVMELSLREQGTLLGGVRMCDVAPKNPITIIDGHGCSTGEMTTERHLVAFLRFAFMVPADEREIDVCGAWFQSDPPERWKPSEFGHYPQHWYHHLMVAFEVVGRKHPDAGIRLKAWRIYERLVENLHLNVETGSQYEARMNEDRIASGNVVS